jgi:hypothetical protein
MIQLYLLILIMIFVIILCINKESFVDGSESVVDGSGSVVDGSEPVVDGSGSVVDGSGSKSDLQCGEDKHRVEVWDGEGVYLYGCNSLYDDDTYDISQVGIKLFWNKSDIENSKTILIVNTEDADDTFIKDISGDQIELDKNENTNVQQPIKTYELKHNIIEGKKYFITVNYVKPDAIYVSNTLQITALSPVPHVKSSGVKMEQQKLMSLLRNKTFDIYL